MTDQTLQETAYEANMELSSLGLAPFTFGNVSAADSDRKVFAIKPSGVAYTDLNPADMVVLNFDGSVVRGNKRPSSDTPTHAHLYRTWSGISGIAHSHSLYATSWAQTGRPIPILGTTHADYLPTDVPNAPFLNRDEVESNYESATGKQITDFFASLNLDPGRVPMTLVAGHGPFTWGASALDAVHHSAVLEQIAHMAWLTLQIDETTNRLPEHIIQKHFSRKHGGNAYYGQITAQGKTLLTPRKPTL